MSSFQEDGSSQDVLDNPSDQRNVDIESRPTPPRSGNSKGAATASPAGAVISREKAATAQYRAKAAERESAAYEVVAGGFVRPAASPPAGDVASVPLAVVVLARRDDGAAATPETRAASVDAARRYFSRAAVDAPNVVVAHAAFPSATASSDAGAGRLVHATRGVGATLNVAIAMGFERFPDAAYTTVLVLEIDGDGTSQDVARLQASGAEALLKHSHAALSGGGCGHGLQLSADVDFRLFALPRCLWARVGTFDENARSYDGTQMCVECIDWAWRAELMGPRRRMWQDAILYRRYTGERVEDYPEYRATPTWYRHATDYLMAKWGHFFEFELPLPYPPSDWKAPYGLVANLTTPPAAPATSGSGSGPGESAPSALAAGRRAHPPRNTQRGLAASSTRDSVARGATALDPAFLGTYTAFLKSVAATGTAVVPASQWALDVKRARCLDKYVKPGFDGAAVWCWYNGRTVLRAALLATPRGDLTEGKDATFAPVQSAVQAGLVEQLPEALVRRPPRPMHEHAISWAAPRPSAIPVPSCDAGAPSPAGAPEISAATRTTLCDRAMPGWLKNVVTRTEEGRRAMSAADEATRNVGIPLMVSMVMEDCELHRTMLGSIPVPLRRLSVSWNGLSTCTRETMLLLQQFMPPGSFTFASFPDNAGFAASVNYAWYMGVTAAAANPDEPIPSWALIINADITLHDNTRILAHEAYANMEDAANRVAFINGGHRHFCVVVLATKAVMRAGGMDENFYPAYFEDIEYVWRVHLAGFGELYEKRFVYGHADGGARKETSHANAHVLQMRRDRGWAQNYNTAKFGRCHGGHIGTYAPGSKWTRPYGTVGLPIGYWRLDTVRHHCIRTEQGPRYQNNGACAYSGVTMLEDFPDARLPIHVLPHANGSPRIPAENLIGNDHTVAVFENWKP